MRPSTSGPKRRVLLVGAFSNGNLGDMYQAEAIAAELAAIDPALEIASTSPSKRGSGYPAINHVAIASDVLFDPERLNTFDLVLVGGGGLLAAPHAPLPDASWVASVRTKICAVSLGCAASTSEESRAFIERCDRFSVRDEFSAEEVKSVRESVEIVMDPILVGRLSGLDVAVSPPKREGILLVPGKLVPGTLDFHARLQRNVLTSPADAIVSFNPETDKKSGFLEIFGSGVTYLDDIEGFAHALAPRRLCVSERYHGCILALKLSTPTIGLALRSRTVTSKITELYRKLGMEKCLVDPSTIPTRTKLRSAAEDGCDFTRIHARLDEERAKLRAYLASCLDLVPATS